MTSSDIVNLVGLGFGTVGAVLLAIDVINGPGKRWQAEVLKTKLENLRHTRGYVRQSTENLPSPPYSAADIKRLLDEEESKWGPEEAELVRQSNTFLPQYENRIVNLGVMGVSLIVLGFALQFVGVLIHVPGT